MLGSFDGTLMHEDSPLAKAKPKLDLLNDAWGRFERAVDVVAKSPPQHRPAKMSARKKRSKPPVSSTKP